VVAFAVAEREENILACAEAGISGYVAQDGSVEDLIAAVQRALRGEVMCSPRVAALLFSRAATLSLPARRCQHATARVAPPLSSARSNGIW